MITAMRRSVDLPVPDTVSELVKSLLRSRGARVLQLLGPALDRSSETAEHVHRLRVAIRRAVSALRVFADWLPAKERRRLCRPLRRLRRRSGAARDLDVMLDRLIAGVAELSNQGRAELCHHVAIERGEAQRDLRRAARRLHRKRFARRLQRWTSRPRWRGHGGEPTVREFIQGALFETADRFITAIGRSGDGPQDWHAVRIAGKRVRYTVEMFADHLPLDQTQLFLAELVELQDALGAWNDCQTAIRTWQQWYEQGFSESVPELSGAIHGEQRRFDDAQRTVMSNWSKARLAALADTLRQLAGGGICG